ncbi:MAG: cytochrome c oxidase subunit I [Gemmatimonadota bacterium]
MTPEPPRTAPGDPGPLEGPLDPELQQAQVERLLKVWKGPSGWRYWSAVNNSEVGRWYTAAACCFFLFGGMLALVMRIQLAVPNNDFVSADLYNQLFTLHGTVMMFLFAVPIFEAFSIFVLPEMLAARELPFPRLSAYGFWCFLLGGIFVCGSIFFGAAPKGGWFMYPPMSTDAQPGIGADIWLLGLSFIEISSLAAAVELIVGVLKCRAPGMRINLIPLYAWYILVVAVMILFAFPPLIAGDILLELERLLDWPFFDPARGGDPLLWQHLFWIFGHPEVYIVFLPSIAIVAMIVPTFARTPMVGYSWIVLAAVGTGFLSFGLWVHHMFTTGLPGISLGFFSAASEAVAIPTGIQIFCFLATLLVGRVSRAVPMLFAFGGLVTFVLGGLTGVMVALVPFDLQAHDTYFVVSHLHYVMIGGTIFPIVAGIHYFFPLLTGKRLRDRPGRLSFWVMFIGFNITFLPMHLSGLRGMPRRVFTYPADLGLDTLNLISSVGAFVLAAGFLPLLWDIVWTLRKGKTSERNPWGAGTLEWLTEMPGQPWGTRSLPEIDSRYPLWDQPDLMRHVDEGRFYLPDAQELKREALVTSPIDAIPQQCLRVSGPSFLPMLSAFATGGGFIFATFHWWWAAAASAGAAVVLLLAWVWTGTAQIPEKDDKDVGLGVVLPTYVSGPESVGWWGVLITMLGDITAFGSLIFGYFFYWTVHPDFLRRAASAPLTTGLLIGGGALLASWLLTLFARRLNGRPRGTAFYQVLSGGLACTLLGGSALVLTLLRSGLDPTAHAYAAIVWVITVWTVLHVALGGLVQAYCLARRAAARLTPRYDIDIVNTTLYWHFLALTVVVTVGVLAGAPWLA